MKRGKQYSPIREWGLVYIKQELLVLLNGANTSTSDQVLKCKGYTKYNPFSQMLTIFKINGILKI